MILLSVVIPTRNRALFLKELLFSLTLQTLDKKMFEVIIVDNGSTDETKQVVEFFYTQLNLRYYYEPTLGLHCGRHLGYRESTSDIIVYADDDIEACSTWLEGIWDSFLDEETMLVGGKNLPLYEITPPFWILEKWYQITPVGHSMPELSLIDLGDNSKQIPAYYVYGCNYAIRKSIIEQAHGFHPDGMPFELIQYRGDGEFCVNRYIENHHLKVMYNPKASVYHKVPKSRLTIDYFCKRAFCQGVEMSYCNLRYGCNQSQKKNKVQTMMKYLLGISFFRKLNEILEETKKSNYDKMIEKSFRIGYNYHQTLYQSDPKLRAWVHKENYL